MQQIKEQFAAHCEQIKAQIAAEREQIAAVKAELADMSHGVQAFSADRLRELLTQAQAHRTAIHRLHQQINI